MYIKQVESNPKAAKGSHLVREGPEFSSRARSWVYWDLILRASQTEMRKCGTK